jgi:hypothetical protein
MCRASTRSPGATLGVIASLGILYALNMNAVRIHPKDETAHTAPSAMTAVRRDLDIPVRLPRSSAHNAMMEDLVHVVAVLS